MIWRSKYKGQERITCIVWYDLYRISGTFEQTEQILELSPWEMYLLAHIYKLFFSYISRFLAKSIHYLLAASIVLGIELNGNGM